MSVVSNLFRALNQKFRSFNQPIRWVGFTAIIAIAATFLRGWSSDNYVPQKALDNQKNDKENNNNVSSSTKKIDQNSESETKTPTTPNLKVVTKRSSTSTGSHVTCFVGTEDSVNELISNETETSNNTENNSKTNTMTNKEDQQQSTTVELNVNKETECVQDNEEVVINSVTKTTTEECGEITTAASTEFLLENVKKFVDNLNWNTTLAQDKWDHVEFDDDMEFISLDLSFASQNKLRFDIMDMSAFLGESLVTLNIEGCGGIQGSIKVLAECPNLENALLSLAALVGDISVFENCPRLKQVSLGSRRGRVPINGDIYVFRSCPELVSVKFFTAVLHGDVSAFSFTPKLKSLNIAKSNIDGDIIAFTKCPELESLTLSLTKVSGSVSSLLECKNLTRLNLRGATNTTGSKEDLAALPNCEVIL
mmetsp:Transcript_30589/g.36065  ORF Transcript_30589/g.36065 Transcript_30589/m.36065 type:complete len:423 (-) Transcript_30589:80-1348(-)